MAGKLEIWAGEEKIVEQLRNRWEDGKNKTGDGRILRRWWIN
jgi:hypothetical protein